MTLLEQLRALMIAQAGEALPLQIVDPLAGLTGVNWNPEAMTLAMDREQVEDLLATASDAELDQAIADASAEEDGGLRRILVDARQDRESAGSGVGDA